MRIRTLVIPAGGFALPACGGRVARARSGRVRRHGCRQPLSDPPPLPSRRITVGIVD